MSITLVPLADAAARLGLDPSTLRHQIRNGRLEAKKLGREWWVTTEAIKRYRKEVQKDV